MRAQLNRGWGTLRMVAPALSLLAACGHGAASPDAGGTAGPDANHPPTLDASADGADGVMDQSSIVDVVAVDTAVDVTTDAPASDGATAADAPATDVAPPPGSVPMFVAVGNGFRRVISCTDGRSWQADQVEVTNPTNDDSLAHGLAYNGGLFVVSVGGGGDMGRIVTTDDGVTWVERVPAGTYNGFSQVAYGNGYFVAGGGNVSIRSATGIDGWGDQASMGSGGILRQMVFGGGHFAAVGGGRIQVGTNATDWAAPTSGMCPGDPIGIVYGQGHFVSVDSTGGTCVSSDGGSTWTNGSVGGGNNVQGILWTGSQFMVTSSDHTYRSADGTTWTSTAGGGPASLALSDSGTYVGIDNGHLVYSTDGMQWTAATVPASPGNNGLNRIVFGYGQPSTTCPGG